MTWAKSRLRRDFWQFELKSQRYHADESAVKPAIPVLAAA